MTDDSCISAMIDCLMPLLLGTKTLFLNRMMPSLLVQSKSVVLRGGVEWSFRHLIIPCMKLSFDDRAWIRSQRSVVMRDINRSSGSIV